MKKPTQHPQPPRRKKTQADIRTDRLRSETTRLHAEAQQKEIEANNKCWDTLNDLQRECTALLQQPAGVAILLRNRELMGHVENITELSHMAQILHKDLVTFKDQLSGIAAKHQGKSGNADEMDDMLLSFQIGSEYQNWMDSFNSVVTVLTADILAAIATANARMEAAAKEKDHGTE